MMEGTSLTEELIHASFTNSNNLGCNNSSSSSPLFSIFGHQTLGYATCWEILHLHKNWIYDKVISLCHDDMLKKDDNERHQLKKKDGDGVVIIGYLSDNSPDLLLSLLGCIDLTTAYQRYMSTPPQLLPALINVRWMPLEIQRALRVNADKKKKQVTVVDEDDGGDEKKQQRHVTMVLYGQGYEKLARQAVHLLNDDDDDGNHFAVALPLPVFATNDTKNNLINHATNNVSDSSSSRHHHHNPSALSDSDALILFTSGTSSPNGAKGVRLSHRSLFIQAYVKTCPPCNYDSQTRLVATTVPWFHVGGISSALAVVLGGGCFVFPPDADHDDDDDDDDKEEGQINPEQDRKRKGFQPNVVLQSLIPRSQLSKQVRGRSAESSTAANTLVVVPAMLHAMFQHQQQQQQQRQQQEQLLPNNNVRLILVGGQSIGHQLYKLTRQYFPKARIVQTYACTEAGSSITFLDLGYSTSSTKVGDRTITKANSAEKDCKGGDGATLVGTPPKHVEVGIFDERSDRGNMIILPIGRMGIIGTRGSHVMSGYWNRGAVNSGERSQRVNDWIITNDLGFIEKNSNNLYFCGRVNDVIRTGGESVLATEVESVIAKHVDVVECAVFALPDEKFGEAVCAAIVLQDESRRNMMKNGVVEDDEWRLLMRKHFDQQQLAGFKRPRRVFQMHSLPRNSSGKVLKYEVVKACAAYSSNRSRL